MKAESGQRPLRQIFGKPLIIALITILGLLAALAGDGLLDVTSWAALGLPIVVILVALRRSRRRATAS